jgi:predicted HicB family RNase H-like nuclease
MNKKDKIRKLIDVKPNTVKRLRLLAAKKETSVKGYIEQLIENHVKQ